MAEPRVFTESEVTEGLRALNGWELRDGRLRKQWTFRTFLRALAFVNSVAFLSEGAGHHPDITINYNKVTLRLITHSEGALTDRDFALAADVDARLASKLMIQADESAGTGNKKTLPARPDRLASRSLPYLAGRPTSPASPFRRAPIAREAQTIISSPAQEVKSPQGRLAPLTGEPADFPRSREEARASAPR